MQSSLFLFFSFLSFFALSSSFRVLPTGFVRPTRSTQKLNMLDFSAFITAVVETKPDDYVYGAVSAPSWALPVGALLVIGTAALPALLRPGEAALEQQRIDEETKGSQFNKKRGPKEW